MTKALKILIIDDDNVDSITIIRSISQSGIIAKVESVFSGKEGLEKAESFQYDLIFLDYMMPDYDGISFLKKLRELGNETPVIFVTSQGDEKIASQAILEGASDYIPKTLLTPDGVSQSIRNTIKLHESYKLRKNAELELNINVKRLAEAQQLAKIGSWEINLFNNNVYFSQELFEIFELDKKSIPSIELLKSSMTSTDDRKQFDNKLEEVKSTIKNVILSHNIKAHKGTHKHITEYIKCLFDENGKPLKVLGTVQDISEQKQNEEELVKAKNIAEESVRVKEQFLTNMSHEIRTPMNGIIGFTKILEDTKLDNDQRQSVEAIKTAGNNLMIIINDILDFSKIEANKMTFEAVDFSLSKLVNSVIELLSPVSNDKKIKLISHINPQIEDVIIGDPTRLSQILINLVGNAIKFTDKGYVELIVDSENAPDIETSIRFTVVDTGIGIEQKKIDLIFESFNQASNETSRKFGGTGLGLTITRRLIELQGGTITVKSEISKGSEFSFAIQYKKGQKNIIESSNNDNKPLSSEFLKDIKILLVEDNMLNQLLAVKVFQKWNKEIDIADNGLIAIDKINSNNYDIILMDVQMPEMDGNELTSYIRSNMGMKANVPIIALTAHATVGEEMRCLNNGMNDYLSKPFDFKVLLEKLRKSLSNSGKIKEAKNKLGESTKIIDFKYLNEFADGDIDFIQNMVALFIQNTPKTLDKIIESNIKDDLNELKNEVHKLKSSVSLLGIEKAMNYIEVIENELVENPLSDKRKKAVDNLKIICNKAIEFLKTEKDLILK
ncbi:hybrid sensor histidine kinase/response regulator [Flavobacterium sp. K5-23]|uniref:hybrid sensor histidine kinase/response regulator n=1 Tax=Flavobacterium sp. K5-23 TaxID=2746225 RepID=UPI00200CBB7E|nr:hybrid sensor histidine kinase/response regulator [Flavobacterium sp. K5-23]UQD56515.1 response regulator [Flavobacterium sp. K5-23]